MKILLCVCLVGLLTTAEAAEQPRLGDPPDFRLPVITKMTFANGLTVTFAPFGNIPKVSIAVYVRTGNINEGSDTWLADLTAELMTTGAGSRNSDDVATDAARMGGELELGVSGHNTTFTLDVLSEHAPDAVALLADVAMRPTFPDAGLSRIVRDLKRERDLALSESSGLAASAYLHLIYGDTPWGRVFPTHEQLDSYTLESVRGYYEQNFGGQRTNIYIVGNFDRKKIIDAVETHFGKWSSGPEPLLGISLRTFCSAEL